MKVTGTPGVIRPQQTGPVRKTGSVSKAANAYTPRNIDDTIQVQGIPQEELTPRVHQAIMNLMQEVETLRHDLENTRSRLREAEDLADMDSLLPVPNRRAFVRELNRMISFAQRYGTPSTLVFIDMNDMKLINDKLGHDAGDKALLHVARLLSDNIRGTDIAARLGGDEFGVLLAQADETIGQEKAKALTDKVMQAPFVYNDESMNIHLAYGAYTFRGDAKPSEALDRADKAMYENKQGMKGENNVR